MTTLVTATLIATGYITRYDPGVMAEVVRNRAMAVDPDHCIAVTDCSLLGQPAQLTWPDLSTSRHIICDCSSSHDRRRHIEQGLAGEVSHSTAKRLSQPCGTRYRCPLHGPLHGVTLHLLREPEPPEGAH